MNLVPEHIDEAIKHLTPRSEEELLKLIDDAPISQKLALAKKHGIKLSSEEINKIESEVKKLFYKTHSLLTHAIIDYNKKYDMKLIIPDYAFFEEYIVHDEYLILKTKDFEQDIDLSKIKIITDFFYNFKIIYYYVLIPDGNFQINTRFETEHRDFGQRTIYTYDENGKLENKIGNLKAKFINEAIKHLTPKTEEEIKDVEKRGFRQNAGKWKFTIDIQSLTDAYEEDDDTESFRMGLIDILTSKIEDLETFMDEYEVGQFQDIIDELNMLDPSPDVEEIDYVLRMLYDWADDNNIWISTF